MPKLNTCSSKTTSNVAVNSDDAVAHTSNVEQQKDKKCTDEADAAPQVCHRKSERRRIARDIFFVLEEQPNRRRGRGRGRGSRGGATHKSKFGYLKIDTNNTNASSSRHTNLNSKRGGRGNRGGISTQLRQLKHEKNYNLKSNNELADNDIENKLENNIIVPADTIDLQKETLITANHTNTNNNIEENENEIVTNLAKEIVNDKAKDDLWALVEFSRVETATPNNSPTHQCRTGLRLEYDDQNDDDGMNIHDANIEMAPASAPAATLRMTPERIIVTPTYSECCDADTITICNFKEDCNFKISSCLRAKIAAVNPIFLWVRQSETRIVEVRCEDYDQRNRLRLTKTRHGWRAMPRTDPCSSKMVKFARCQHVKPPLLKIKNELLALHEQRKKCKQVLGESELMLYTATKANNGTTTTHICTDITFNENGFNKNIKDHAVQEWLETSVQHQQQPKQMPMNFQHYKSFNNAYKVRKRLRHCNFNSMRKRKHNYAKSLLNFDVEKTANWALSDYEQLQQNIEEINSFKQTFNTDKLTLSNAYDMDELNNKTAVTSEITLTAEEDQLLNDLVAVADLVEQPIVNAINDDSESINETSKNLKDLLDDHGLLLLENYGDSGTSDVEFIESLVKRSCDSDLLPNGNVSATVDIVAALDDARLTLSLTPQLDNDAGNHANINNNNNLLTNKCLPFNDLNIISDSLNNDDIFNETTKEIIKTTTPTSTLLETLPTIHNIEIDKNVNEKQEQINGLDEQLQNSCLNLQQPAIQQQQQQFDSEQQEQLLTQNKLAQQITEHKKTTTTNTNKNTITTKTHKQTQELSQNSENFIYKLHGVIGKETINANNIPILINNNDNAEDCDATTTATPTTTTTTNTTVTIKTAKPDENTTDVTTNKLNGEFQNKQDIKCNELEKTTTTTAKYENINNTINANNCEEEPLKKRFRNPTSIEINATTTTIITNDEKPDPDPLTQLHLLLTNTEWIVPDPILVPEDRLDAVLESPAREIPLLLTTRRDLKLPQAFATPKIIYNPKILVVSMYQLEAILKGELNKSDLINSCDLFNKYKNCTPEQIIAIMMASQQRPSCLMQQQQQIQIQTTTANTVTSTATANRITTTITATSVTTTRCETVTNNRNTTTTVANLPRLFTTTTSITTPSTITISSATTTLPAIALPSLVISSPVTPSSSLSSPMLPSPVLPPPPPPPLLPAMRLTPSPQQLHNHQHKQHRRAIAAGAASVSGTTTAIPQRRHTVSIERGSNSNQNSQTANLFPPHLYLQHNRVDPYQRLTQQQQEHEPIFNLHDLQQNVQQEQQKQERKEQQQQQQQKQHNNKSQSETTLKQQRILLTVPSTTTTITTTYTSTTSVLVTTCATGTVATVATTTTAATTTPNASILTTTADITATAALTEQVLNFPVPPLWFLSHLLQLANATDNATGTPLITPLMMHIALQRHQQQLQLQVQQYNQIMLWYEQRKREMTNDKPTTDMATLPPLSLADLTSLLSYYMPPTAMEQAMYQRILRDQFGTIFSENVNVENELSIKNSALNKKKIRKSSTTSNNSLDSIASSSSSNLAENNANSCAALILPPPPPPPPPPVITESQINFLQSMNVEADANVHDSITEELQRLKAAMAKTVNNDCRPRLSCRSVEELLEKTNVTNTKKEQQNKTNKNNANTQNMTDAVAGNTLNTMHVLPEWQQIMNKSNAANNMDYVLASDSNMGYTRAHRRSNNYATAERTLMQPPGFPAHTSSAHVADRNVGSMRAPMRRASVDSIALENNQKSWQHSCNSQDTTGYPSQWNWTTVTATGE